MSLRSYLLSALLGLALVNHYAAAQEIDLTNRYIIKIKDGADANKGTRLNPPGESSALTHFISELKDKFTMQSFNAYSSVLSEPLAKALLENGDVEYVEAEQIFKATGVQQNPPSWGLWRVSQRDRNPSAPYNYPDSAGSGVDVYIIDTGINVKHVDFGGRATFPRSFISGEAVEDLNGHGTHVAGTVGGTTYGVAKKVNLIGVKVLNKNASGSTSAIVAGINWVAQQAKATGRKSVANMSLGGGNSDALKSAVNAAVKSGVSFFVAAMNDNQDACNVSPANADGAFTVAATTISDTAASFTNYGRCVNIAGPGLDITSAWIGGNNAYRRISGTSMATPHVAGVAALYLAQENLTSPQSVYDTLAARATKNAITGLKGNTPNLLVHNSK
ncbi:subtilisin-like protein [Basidiobolus meristosporus CBS 931.73]|uniref:Subtilisin-like protein n=1 Tax=Basidiobolus meristosporus CBS 931.73 TaxID=1314790 RepID=A0A1Y1XDW3_9FUNG|nr:subtilisin-like protein [Basidiobolus meristosporus CBS 931.73]|eukprot:ORX83913.1 subtilisin-like protein [Basidiobolus meristosporus CBS 931.73]